MESGQLQNFFVYIHLTLNRSFERANSVTWQWLEHLLVVETNYFITHLYVITIVSFGGYYFESPPQDLF